MKKPVKSYAKINLFLDVVGRRDDGYHEIRTVFAEIELYDELNFLLTKDRDIKILANKSFVETKDNIIFKVAKYMQDRYRPDCGLEIGLVKHIPVQAGLGGGSSNAAVTIKQLSELWSLDLTMEEMNEIAALFGSDINFFLYGGTALGEKRGEKITQLDYIDIDNILLVKPDFGISSSDAYKQSESGEINENYLDLVRTKKVEFCYNKLEEKIKTKHKTIAEIISEMKELGAKQSILSGSGPTVIGFYADQEAVQKAKVFFEDRGFWNCITKTRRSNP